MSVTNMTVYVNFSINIKCFKSLSGIFRVQASNCRLQTANNKTKRLQMKIYHLVTELLQQIKYIEEYRCQQQDFVVKISIYPVLLQSII